VLSIFHTSKDGGNQLNKFIISQFILVVSLMLGYATAEGVLADDETVVVLSVNAPDGPMPQFLSDLREARLQDIPRVVVHVTNVSVLDDAELLALVMIETEELMLSYAYDESNSEIIQCPRQCNEPEDPPEQAGNGETTVITVYAPDGPMPQTRVEIGEARARDVSRVVVHLEQTALIDAELVELVEMEISELLTTFKYTSRNSEIVQCLASC
jgi:translation elongation factor EF-Tu-like GTPase